MGLLSLLGFGHPLTDYLEAELTKTIINHIKQNDTSFDGNLKNAKKSIRIEFDSLLKQMFSEENAKVKKTWREFREILEDLEQSALKLVLKNSLISSYSQEQSYEILSLPKALLAEKTMFQLSNLLAAKIEFKNMIHDTRRALSRYAIDVKFDSILNSLRKNKEIVSIDFSRYILADEIPHDYYYVNIDSIASRVHMLFFSEVSGLYSSTAPKEIKDKTKKAMEKWQNHRRYRPDNRRFDFTKWQ